jgi:FkbM family methyltransferase
MFSANTLRRNRYVRNLYALLETPLTVFKNRSMFGLLFRRNFIKYIDPDCIFDIGANIGQFVTDVRSVNSQVPIYSFEPVNEAFFHLKVIEERDTYFQAINCGIGESGPRNLYVSDNYSLSSSVYSPDEHLNFARNVNFEYRQTANFITLFDAIDSYAKGKERIFLKVDVQGAELEVLSNLKSMKNVISGIIVEASFTSLYSSGATFYKTLELLHEAGFSVVKIDNQGINQAKIGYHYCDIYALKNVTSHQV